ncbi:MAG: TolC family protein, partial [Treponema sp.]
MKKKLHFVRARRTFFFSAVLFFCGFCFAQQKETRIITVDDAVSLALENNISIKRNQITLETLELKNKYSWNSVSPSINVSANYNQPLGNGKNDNYSLTASGSVSIRLSPSVYTSIQSAKLNYEMGKISYEQAVKSVELEVRNAFYQMLYAKENLSLLERNLETAKQRYNLNLEKYQKGQLSELDLLSAQYSYESLIPNIEASQITMENDMSTFKQLLGLNQTESIELSGSLDDFLSSFDFTLSFDINEIPSMKNLNYQIESAKNQLLATRFSAYGPSLSLGFSAGKDLKNTDSALTSSLSVGVSVPLDGFLPWSSGALSIAN